VDRVAELLRPTLDKRIEWRLALQEPTPVVKGDSAQVEQIVMNLCINARDALPAGGELQVMTETVHLDESACLRFDLKHPGAYAHIQVGDTGVGIAPELLKRIFDPFFSTKDSEDASGLGLSVVWGVVRGLGGSCKIKSQQGQGTQVDVFLPAAEESAPVFSNLVAAAGAEEVNVLVVDDEEMIRTFLVTLLRSLKYQVRTAVNGADALRLVRQNPDAIDLVLLDLNMPEKSGEEAFAELKQIRSDLKVIVMTGGGLSEIARELVTVGADGYLPKPFTFQEVSSKVAEVLAL
jgi:CheY-like chemotaxis protein